LGSRVILSRGEPTTSESQVLTAPLCHSVSTS